MGARPWMESAGSSRSDPHLLGKNSQSSRKGDDGHISPLEKYMRAKQLTIDKMGCCEKWIFFLTAFVVWLFIFLGELSLVVDFGV